MSPYEKVMAALKHEGLLRGGKPQCPTCPPRKRRGFTVTEAKTRLGHPTVLVKCFRDCDTLTEIVPALGLDPAELYDGGVIQPDPFKGVRFSPVTIEGWKALPEYSTRTFGIAASIGYFSTPNSPYRVLRTSDQWEALLQDAGVDDRRLRRHVQSWCQARMAHRCETRGVLALYRGPLDRCPRCGRLSLEPPYITRKNAHKGHQRPVRMHDSVVNAAKGHHRPGERSPGDLLNAQMPWEKRFPEGDGSPAWADEKRRRVHDVLATH
jgi:hypothetical protein